MKSTINEPPDNAFSMAAIPKILAEWTNFKKEDMARRKRFKREIGIRYGRSVKLARCKRLISESSFATLCGVSYSHMAKIESGWVLPSPGLHGIIMRVLRETPEHRPSGRLPTGRGIMQWIMK